ncbi:serine/threonine protein kinase [Actinoplanes sp. N902-109]|uniref:serine/threonine protein kinase n=1 Tax=Actinoplanes sp. (strain N902-109) TaxID=649831 RepID=UPI000329445C|nr:serine/threonine protein kinase [Actinoplanes sp. N902-109]AGL19793.1 hypothetical protein L083_6283 [Actinoplanes sp. N902-109]
MMTFDEAVTAIERAGTFADLFPGGSDTAEDALTSYRRLLKVVHPDVAPAGRGATATQAAATLSALFEARALIARGDVADLVARGPGELVKTPRLPGDNDLMRAEATALRTLHRDGDPRYRAYAPRLIDTVTEDGRQANVLDRLAGFVPLTGLDHRLDPRDVAWMWRRLLTGLGWAHRAGLVHGAIVPEHVLIHPGEHGVVLVDWCYSVPTGGTVTAIVARHRAAYPPEIPAKQPATAATDIHMATGLMLRLIDNPPDRMRRFAAGCRYAAPRMRPQDAWQLLTEFDELLEDLYGPRRFRPFALPVPAATH